MNVQFYSHFIIGKVVKLLNSKVKLIKFKAIVGSSEIYWNMSILLKNQSLCRKNSLVVRA